jgi:hypothetical protein
MRELGLRGIPVLNQQDVVIDYKRTLFLGNKPGTEDREGNEDNDPTHGWDNDESSTPKAENS